MPERHFGPGLFAFLRELKANNSREWFEANKARYESQVREPALQFIRDFEPYLEAISPRFRADDRRAGGSLFRIHRDVRFARDKSPYKTSIGIQFRHEEGKNVHCPGYYVHLEPKSVFVGAGIWHPESSTLTRIRQAIVDDADGWSDVVGDRDFAATYEFGGDSLSRPPKGFPADHLHLDDLKRKDFIGVATLSQGAATSAGFIDRVSEHCRAATPLMRYLCAAVEVDF